MDRRPVSELMERIQKRNREGEQYITEEFMTDL